MFFSISLPRLCYVNSFIPSQYLSLPSCNFSAVRRIVQVGMLVHKRNGSQEEWMRQKMVKSLTSAGVVKVEAELITSLIYEMLSKRGTYTVESSYLREKVIALLRTIESNCADAYEYFSNDPQT